MRTATLSVPPVLHRSTRASRVTRATSTVTATASPVTSWADLPPPRTLATVGASSVLALTGTGVAELAAAVRDARTSAGLTQGDLAAKIGVSRPWISQFERGCTPNAGIDRILAMINVLGIRLSMEGPATSAAADTPTAAPSTATPTAPLSSLDTSHIAWRDFSTPAPAPGNVAKTSTEAVADAAPTMDLSHLAPDVSSFYSNLFATQNARLRESLRTGAHRRTEGENR